MTEIEAQLEEVRPLLGEVYPTVDTEQMAKDLEKILGGQTDEG